MANHIRINGVTLPDRNVGIQGITNNVVLYVDGTYAAVRDGKVVTGQVPANGEIDIDGVKIRASGASGIYSRVSVGNIGGSISISRGNITNHTVIDHRGVQVVTSVGDVGASLDERIDETYELQEGDAVEMRVTSQDLRLGLQEGTCAAVTGESRYKPRYKNRRLDIVGLEGMLALPKAVKGLTLTIYATSGDIEGDVAHPGSICVTSGDVDLTLYAPLDVETRAVSGDVEVIGMISKGRGRYGPVGGDAQGTLRIETTSGDISLKYVDPQK